MTVRHYLSIDSTMYLLSPLVGGYAEGWSLSKLPDGESYHCHKDRHGLHCDCPDAVYRRENVVPGTECKHARALVEAHLLERN